MLAQDPASGPIEKGSTVTLYVGKLVSTPNETPTDTTGAPARPVRPDGDDGDHDRHDDHDDDRHDDDRADLADAAAPVSRAPP